ncbi:MAG TPA: M56 family metallopeptidase [Gammaproteobacteria bacterium]|jgi:beta-lactamase regulating signal transducer with metallopeptidase domain|nr:M56 family metallopeptidase [Gammaproteobacteria bacterium]
MSPLDTLLGSTFAYHLGWTLLHFLWQGTVVGVLYACLRNLMADAAPQARYLLSLSMLAVLALLPVATLWYLSGTPLAVRPVEGFAAGAHIFIPPPQSSWLDMLRELLHPLVPWTVPAWSAGVALLGFKSIAGWRRARRLTRHASHMAPVAWQDTTVRLAAQVGVRVHVCLMITAQVTVPCVVGWLKPVILLPPAALTGLSTLQLEMVLAHELSHVHRHDYLVNLLQIVVETLLFYHPVVRWISRDARREREHCCDDTAVHACGDALHYAHALTDLEALRSGDMAPALGLNGGDLAMRVERLIAPHPAAATPRLTTMALISALCFSSLLALTSARHLPLAQNPSLFTHLSNPIPARVPESLQPTPLQAVPPMRAVPALLTAVAATERTSLPTVTAPPAQPVTIAAPTASAAPQGPLHIGGAPLSSLLHPGDYDTALSANKRAGAQLDFVRMHPASGDAATNKTHDRCEPITGSRVCS